MYARRLIASYSRNLGLEDDAVRLQFKGVKVEPTKTPSDYLMRDSEEVEVQLVSGHLLPTNVCMHERPDQT